MNDTTAPNRSPAEELANGVVSALGVVLSAAGLAVMVIRSWKHGTTVHVTSAAVFGCSLLALHGASTCYHLAKNAERKQFLRQIDHAAIFLLIAGTYTPFTLVTLHGSWGGRSSEQSGDWRCSGFFSRVRCDGAGAACPSACT